MSDGVRGDACESFATSHAHHPWSLKQFVDWDGVPRSGSFGSEITVGSALYGSYFVPCFSSLMCPTTALASTPEK